MCMDHFLVLIGLFIIIPCYINGQTDSIPTAIAATTAPYTGCKTSETHSPPSVYCNAYCGDDIPTVIEQVCDSRKKRSKTGITFCPIHQQNWDAVSVEAVHFESKNRFLSNFVQESILVLKFIETTLVFSNIENNFFLSKNRFSSKLKRPFLITLIIKNGTNFRLVFSGGFVLFHIFWSTLHKNKARKFCYFNGFFTEFFFCLTPTFTLPQWPEKCNFFISGQHKIRTSFPRYFYSDWLR